MGAKDYYVVLGVSRSESPRGIRKAFRDLVREHHPDRAGPEGTPMFRDVVEAYRVLSDPSRRRTYDARLLGRDPHHPGLRAARDRAVASRVWCGPRDLFDASSEIFPSSEALLDRILRNFLGRFTEKGERPEPLFCDIALDEEEARRGGVLPIRIPIIVPCASCHGWGSVASFPCHSCDADGEARSEIVVPLEVPPGVRPGTVLDASLDSWGIHNLWLRARIGVRG